MIEVGMIEVGMIEVGRIEVSRIELGKIELGKIELGKTKFEVAKVEVNAPRSGTELDRTRLGKPEVGKTDVKLILMNELGRIELARSELIGKLEVSAPRSRTELGRIELGSTEVNERSSGMLVVRTPTSTSVDVVAGTSLGAAAASTLSIGAAVDEEGAALVVNGMVLLSTRQLKAGQKTALHILPRHNNPTTSHLIAPLTRCEQRSRQRRPLNQQRRSR